MNGQSKPSLRDLQQWMHQVITDPRGVSIAIASAEANELIATDVGHVEDVITRSRALDSVSRLEIYSSSYYARLLDCLRSMFTALVHTLGEETFDGFSLRYLQTYPPSSYSLGHLADHFVDFLRETRPANTGEDPVPDWPEFLIDLASLEWNIDQVFDGVGMEGKTPLRPEDLAGISPDAWHKARLIPSPCLRLLSFRFPVSDYFAEVRAGNEPEIPSPAPSYVVLHRQDYVVRRYEVTRVEYELLSALYGGDTVGNAIERLSAEVEDLMEFGQRLSNWFQFWGTESFFQSVQSE